MLKCAFEPPPRLKSPGWITQYKNNIYLVQLPCSMHSVFSVRVFNNLLIYNNYFTCPTEEKI